MTVEASLEPSVADELPAPVVRLDMALVRDASLLVYGWVLGFGSILADATIAVEGQTINLASSAIPVPRPDVTAKFSDSFDSTDDYHGFYLLVDLPVRISTDTLHLTLTTTGGKTAETDWPMVSEADTVALAIDRLSPTFVSLSRKLPVPEQRRLTRFCRSDLGLTQMLAPSVKAGVETCCLMEDRFLFVYGWLQDPHELVTQLEFCAGDAAFDLTTSAQLITPAKPEATSLGYSDLSSRRWFALGVPLKDRHVDRAEFGMLIDSGDGPVFLWTSAILEAGQARGKLAAFLEATDANTAMLLINGLRDQTSGDAMPRSFAAWLDRQHRAAVDRLPVGLHDPAVGVEMQIDSAVRVGSSGLFIIGWVNSPPLNRPQIICVCGMKRFDVTANWLDHRRPDVLRHLSEKGSATADNSHGFACFIPVSDGDSAYFLEITAPHSDPWRVRLDVPALPSPAIDTVRSILRSFSANDWNIGALLDHHVGPAVASAWQTHGRIQGKSFVQSFGAAPINPEISIIVPLFGRYDLAEYQMALFADDPDFRANELIYVVDDPAIFDEFRLLCPELYAIYRVPFVLAYPGANLGFSGANNYGARLARGAHLLLMNSDVFPKVTGLPSKLREIYLSASRPGILGTKLLFEDGSLQHAGIEFRRHAAWNDMWINHHPFKGQTPFGLTGVKEVAAVTAACAFVDAEVYRTLGGLSEDYILGDFEDTDLCLKAHAAGLRNWIALDLEFYHLERQSQNLIGDGRWRSNLTLYNCWVHDRRWASVIEGLSA